MWILPADLSDLHIELSAGPYLVPSHYDNGEIDKLCSLLRVTVKGVEWELRLDSGTLDSLLKRRVTTAGALVLLRRHAASPANNEVLEQASELGARCVLIQLPEPQEAGYGWLEREVKAPLYRAMGTWLKRPAHPLSPFNIQALPVLEAAGLTTDPVELVELVERCVAHRIRHADIGCDEPDYRRSLLVTAGERLTERLSRLEGEDLQAALEVLLWEGAGPESRDRLAAGATALLKVGLASYISGDLRLGPLARGIRERELLGALEAGIERSAWTEESRRKLSERNRSLDVGRAVPALTPISAPAGTARVALPVDDLQELIEDVFPPDVATAELVTLLLDLTRVPGFSLVLNADLQARLVEALRWLEPSSKSTDLRARETSRLLAGLLQLLAERGANALDSQERALRQVEEALGLLHPVWAEDLRLAAMFWNASARVRWPRSKEDLDAASSMLEQCLGAWSDGDRRAAAHLVLGEIATVREDYARAREHCEAALQLALGHGHRENEAAAELGLARGALAESRFAEAEQHALKPLAFYDKTGDAHGVATAQLVLGAALNNQQRREEAQHLLNEALATFKSTGDVGGQVECATYLGGTLLSLGHGDGAESLVAEAADAALDAGLPASAALAFSSLAGFRLGKGAIDEAVHLFERASNLYDSVGFRPKSARTMRSAATALPRDTRTREIMGGLLRAASALAYPKT